MTLTPEKRIAFLELEQEAKKSIIKQCLGYVNQDNFTSHSIDLIVPALLQATSELARIETEIHCLRNMKKEVEK